MDVRRVFGAGAVGLALLATACGGSSSSDSAQPTEEGLKGAATSFAKVLVAGDWSKAYDYMTEDCQSSKTRAEFAVETGAAMELVKAFGLDFSKAEITDVEVRNVVDGNGEVLITAEIDGEPMDSDPSWDPWVFEEGSWRNVDCGAMDTESSSSSDSSDGATDTTVGGELRPSGEAQAEKELSAATTAAIGETVELGDGVTVKVTGVSLGRAYGDPAVAVSLRVENRGDDTRNPDVGVRCAGSTDDGMATSDGTTYETWGDLPAGATPRASSTCCRRPVCRARDRPTSGSPRCSRSTTPPSSSRSTPPCSPS